jgi:hypothetical protein
MLGQKFQPVTVRVTDSSAPPNPVIGANVVFQSVVLRLIAEPPPVSVGGIIVGKGPMPVVVSSSQVSVISGSGGWASIQPSIGGVQGSAEVEGTVSAGTNTIQFLLQAFAPLNQGTIDQEHHADLPGRESGMQEFPHSLLRDKSLQAGTKK